MNVHYAADELHTSLTTCTLTSSFPASAEIVAWLGQGPSAESLRTLVVPYQSPAAHAVLGHFGSTVEHLQMPLRELDSQSFSLSAYFITYR